MPHNVFIIHLDDTDPDLINVAFPQLTQWADGKWTSFPNGIISTPVCYASRCTQWTGQRADRNGGDIPDVTDWGPAPWDESKSIVKALSNAGYDVGIVGKYLNKYPWNVAPWNQTAYVPDGVSWMRLEHASQNEYLDWDHVDENLNITAHGSADTDYRTDVEAGFLTDFFNQATQPWALFWSPLAAHLPGTLPPNHASDPVIDSRTGKGYDDPDSDPGNFNNAGSGKASWMTGIGSMDSGQQASMRTQRLNMAKQHLSTDDAIQNAIDWLKTNNQLENTVIMIYSDNGATNGRHRLYTGSGLKRTPYEHSVDAILRIRHPDSTNSGLRVDNRLITTVDIGATLLDIAGATPLLTQDGISIEPLVMNTPGTVWRTGIEAAGFNEPVADLLAGEAPSWWSFRNEKHKYIWWPDQGNGTEHEELYDLDSDPDELTNLASSETEIRDWLKARLRFARSQPDGARTEHFS